MIIFQHLYWPGIRNVVRREVTNYDTCQCTKLSKIKYGKLTSNEVEEITWNKMCVDLIGTYTIQREERKLNLHLKAVTMIDPIAGWSKITQYKNKEQHQLENLVETT